MLARTSGTKTPFDLQVATFDPAELGQPLPQRGRDGLLWQLSSWVSRMHVHGLFESQSDCFESRAERLDQHGEFSRFIWYEHVSLPLQCTIDHDPSDDGLSCGSPEQLLIRQLFEFRPLRGFQIGKVVRARVWIAL
jgi:hypothetical protein